MVPVHRPAYLPGGQGVGRMEVTFQVAPNRLAGGKAVGNAKATFQVTPNRLDELTHVNMLNFTNNPFMLNVVMLSVLALLYNISP
jgi:hypothetical protein